MYIDSSSSNPDIENALRAVEARLARKTAEEEQLLQRCESLTAALDAHRQGEREANERIMELEEEIIEMQSQMKKKDEKILELEITSMVVSEKVNYSPTNNGQEPYISPRK